MAGHRPGLWTRDMHPYDDMAGMHVSIVKPGRLGELTGMLAELERLAKRVMYPFEQVPWGMTLGLMAIGMLISCGIGDGVAGDANPLGQGKVERCEAAQGFVWVGGGAFVAGSDRAERDLGYTLSAQADGPADKLAQRVQALRQREWFDGEGKRRQVSLPGFCLARDLVTQAEYQRFVRATGHRAPGISEAEYQGQGFLVHPYGTVRRFLWEGDEFPVGRAQDPVVLVSYDDALAFAAWRGDPRVLAIAHDRGINQ